MRASNPESIQAPCSIPKRDRSADSAQVLTENPRLFAMSENDCARSRHSPTVGSRMPKRLRTRSRCRYISKKLIMQTSAYPSNAVHNFANIRLWYPTDKSSVINIGSYRHTTRTGPHSSDRSRNDSIRSSNGGTPGSMEAGYPVSVYWKQYA